MLAVVSECEGELFEKQTTEKVSSVRSDVQYDKVTVNHSRIDKVRQQKIFISPRHIIRKSQISKANLEGLRFSRTLPNLSTECTSTQSCSERAILFSKQQMYDMESLALKLMNELKSMKDIVEQKLLFQAYRNGSLKNDAEEVCVLHVLILKFTIKFYMINPLLRCHAFPIFITDGSC